MAACPLLPDTNLAKLSIYLYGLVMEDFLEGRAAANETKIALPGGIRKKKKKLFLCVVLLVLVLPAAVFFCRAPVLIVTDISFSQLYGSTRLRLRQGISSLELFRRVISVPLAESAGTDLVLLALEGISRSPRAVLFPERYREAAGLYGESHPAVRVLVMEGRNPDRDSRAGEGGNVFSLVRTDVEADLYRAGLCAAELAGEKREVIFFYDEALQNEHREAFREGLKVRGHQGEPVYVSAGSDYDSFANTGCVVIAGPAAKYLEKNLGIPAILFSWADPALCPRAVKVVFDDSPWALMPAALAAVSPREKSAASSAGRTDTNETVLLPSKAVALGSRMEKKYFRIIRALIKEKFQKK